MFMIATDFQLVSQAVLDRREDIVLRRLDSLPFSYQKNLLDEPEIRYPFLNYMLLTYWPELVNGDEPELRPDELLYNRLYWFLRLSMLYRAAHDSHGGFEQQASQLIESAE